MKMHMSVIIMEDFGFETKFCDLHASEWFRNPVYTEALTQEVL